MEIGDIRQFSVSSLELKRLSSPIVPKTLQRGGYSVALRNNPTICQFMAKKKMSRKFSFPISPTIEQA